MSRFRIRIAAAMAVLICCASGALAEFRALATVDGTRSEIRDIGSSLELRLSLSQPVPWRVFTASAPNRLVVELQEATWSGEIPVTSNRAGDLTTGRAGPGWSRLVLNLNTPFTIDAAELRTGVASDPATLEVNLTPATEAEALARAKDLDPAGPSPILPASGRPVVVLDPGHGGIDPGAVVGELVEADLMLTFARELRGVLRATEAFDIVLTRDADVFVPLEARITRARQAGADFFLSLHADALPPDAGRASGATIYTLAAEASDRASELLAERHDQDDLIAGVDLTGQGDEIALVLMDLARSTTAPRSAALADHLVAAIASHTGATHSNPRRHAAFSVLKAPDFPSVLIEVGFLSSARDRKRLADPAERPRSLSSAAVVETIATEEAPRVPLKSEADLILEARMKGYEGEACGDCGNFTMVRNGTCLKCNTCGATSGCS